MSVSVIITTFNRPDFLKKAYKSVIDQTLKPEEVLIINNGKNQIKYKNFKKNKDIKLKIINNKKNLFCSRARNLGANKSKCKYLAFLDDDDMWEKNYLKGSINNLKKKNADIIISKIYLIDNNKYFKFKDPDNFSQKDIFIKNPGITGSNIIIKKDVFKSLGGYIKKLEPSEDKSLVIDALIKNKIITTSKNKIFYSVHYQDRLTTNYKKLIVGKKNFLKRYQRFMSLYQIMYLKNLINIFQFKSGKIYFLPKIILFNILFKIRGFFSIF